jgi:hypothetical protein
VQVPLTEAASPHRIAVSVRRPGGGRVPLLVTGQPEPVTAVTGAFTVPEPPAAARADPDAVNVSPLGVLLDLRLDEPGACDVVVEVDGRELRRLPFGAGLVPAPGQV